MDAYTYQELLEYAENSKYAVTEEMLKKVVGVCETPYEIDLLMKYGVDDFFNYVNLVIENIYPYLIEQFVQYEYQLMKSLHLVLILDSLQ